MRTMIEKLRIYADRKADCIVSITDRKADCIVSVTDRKADCIVSVTFTTLIKHINKMNDLLALNYCTHKNDKGFLLFLK
jgi:hypothetical protein